MVLYRKREIISTHAFSQASKSSPERQGYLYLEWEFKPAAPPARRPAQLGKMGIYLTQVTTIDSQRKQSDAGMPVNDHSPPSQAEIVPHRCETLLPVMRGRQRDWDPPCFYPRQNEPFYREHAGQLVI